jgi:3-mercaptopyruvate sulfurtransferase SseA
MAAYELAQSGFTKLATLRGGFNKWMEAGRDVSSNKYEDW